MSRSPFETFGQEIADVLGAAGGKPLNRIKLSPTRAQLGSRCYRRHALGNVSTLALRGRGGVGPKSSNPHAAFGTVIHAAAAAHWHHPRLEMPEHAARVSWAEEFGDTEHKDYSREMALAIVEGYVARAEAVPLVPGRFVQIMLEERIEVPIEEFILTFKIDRMYGDGSQDHMVFVDTKTASRMDARWRAQWDLSLQMKLYKYGVYLKWGKVPDGVIEGVLKKVPTKLEYVLLPDWDMDTLAEAGDQFLTIARQDAKLVDNATVEGKIDLDVLWQEAATVTSFNENDCYSYGSPCPFLEVCKTTPSERLPLIKSAYEMYEVEEGL